MRTHSNIIIVNNDVKVNCIDRHYLKNPNKVALIWEKDEPGTQQCITYRYKNIFFFTRHQNQL